MLIESAIVLALIVVNGLLAMSELAIVSARTVRLRLMREQGHAGAAAAIRLAEHPGRFLSAVQIGITLVGVLSGAFSGATLGARCAAWLGAWGLPPGIADALGVGSVVIAITYLSLIAGELVPKQIALRDPERIAARVAPAMILLSRVSSPLVWILDGSGRALLRLLGHRGQREDRMTEEEVRTVIAEATTAGIIARQEKELLSGVMRLADRSARALMTPRREVEVVDLAGSLSELREQIRRTRRSRLVARDGDPDAIVGIINVRDALDAVAADGHGDVRALVRRAPVVLDTAQALDVLTAIRATPVHMALVFDEHGHFEGIVTSGDVLEAIAGAFREGDQDEPALVIREDGSFLVSGWMPIDEFGEKTGVPVQRDVGYETVAGLALHALRRVPHTGESFVIGPWHFEIVDMDGRRIDKMLVRRAA